MEIITNENAHRQGIADGAYLTPEEAVAIADPSLTSTGSVVMLNVQGAAGVIVERSILTAALATYARGLISGANIAQALRRNKSGSQTMKTINTTQEATAAGIDCLAHISVEDRIAALGAAVWASDPATYRITVKDGNGEPVTLKFATSEAHFAFLDAIAP